MGRLDIFNISTNDFQKYGIKIDYETGLELATEYEKLCMIRDSKGKLGYCKCQNCLYLGFNFNQDNYQISYFCKKDEKEKITLENLEKDKLCKNFIKNI